MQTLIQLSRHSETHILSYLAHFWVTEEVAGWSTEARLEGLNVTALSYLINTHTSLAVCVTECTVLSSQ